MLSSNPSDRHGGRRVARASVPLLVLAVAATACVHAKPPGLKIENLESSIVFGLKPVPVVAPPGTPVKPVLPPATPAAQDVAAPPSPDVPAPPAPPAPPKPPTPAAAYCRTATINDFPTVAPLGAPKPPKEGFYFFKPAPPQLFGTDHYSVTAKDLQPRLIANVTKPVTSDNPVNGAPPPVGGGAPVTTTQYQYDQVTYLDNTGKNFLVDRIQVTDNPIQQSVVENIGPSAYAGGPDRGVALYGRQLVQNGSSAKFLPSSPVLLLPLPAVSGQTWQSVGVDPASGATYILYGRIITRQRVDACGDVVEAWEVEAQTVFKDPRAASAQNANWHYYVNTGNGGQIVYEKIEPIAAPANPANGTPADAAIPAAPDLPPNAAAAPASEWSLANRDPLIVPVR